VAVAEEEARAGRGMVREGRGRGSDLAAEEWAEAAAARGQAPAAEAREPGDPVEVAERVQEAACGNRAPAEVVAQVQEAEDQEAGEAEPAAALVEVGEQVVDRVGVAEDKAEVAARAEVRGLEADRVGAAARVQVWVAAVAADLVAEVVRVAAADLAAGAVPVQEEDLAEVELDRAERGSQENG
jgi:hypothetical protein